MNETVLPVVKQAPAETCKFMGINISDFGLEEQDLPAVWQTVEQINGADSLREIGERVSKSAATLPDRLLGFNQDTGLQEANGKLAEILTHARSITEQSKQSPIPIIGRFIDNLRNRKDNFTDQFASTREQIQQIMDEVGRINDEMKRSNQELEQMFDDTVAVYKQTGIHIVAGKSRIYSLGQEIEALAAQPQQDDLTSQKLLDLRQTQAGLENMVGNLIVSQHNLLQTLPAIRMLQATNQTVMEKYHVTRTVTFPSWTRWFVLAKTQENQAKAIELSNQIDDTTNLLLEKSADMLHQNATQAARAVNRSVIETQTLKDVQDKMFATLSEVIEINKEGALERQRQEQEIKAMRESFQARIKQG